MARAPLKEPSLFLGLSIDICIYIYAFGNQWKNDRGGAGLSLVIVYVAVAASSSKLFRLSVFSQVFAWSASNMTNSFKTQTTAKPLCASQLGNFRIHQNSLKVPRHFSRSPRMLWNFRRYSFLAAWVCDATGATLYMIFFAEIVESHRWIKAQVIVSHRKKLCCALKLYCHVICRACNSWEYGWEYRNRKCADHAATLYTSIYCEVFAWRNRVAGILCDVNDAVHLGHDLPWNC